MRPLIDPVLVVGTTADYIERISEKLPDRAVFLTDFDVYSGSISFPRQKGIQIFSSLHKTDEVLSRLNGFLGEQKIRLRGVACFDCESLLLASEIAERYSLQYPPRRAVLNSRDKIRSRRLWNEKGLRCPRAILARDEEDVLAFLDILDNLIVLKPISLSGSELTYICDRQEDAVEAFQTIKKGLRRRSKDKSVNRDCLIDENSLLCEEFIPGVEYSCDYICDGTGVKIIRIARKYLLEEGPAGTVQAYEVPGMSREKVEELDLRKNIAEAVQALGLERCMGMADFIIHNGEPYFLEITPRPGGDCLPQVIEHSCGMNILGAHIDFAAERDLRIPPENEWKHTVGLRVHAKKRGSLSTIRLWAGRISQEILETGWYREAGDRISLPPDDYKTWVLGHIIFRPHSDVGIPEQIRDILEAIEIRIE